MLFLSACDAPSPQDEILYAQEAVEFFYHSLATGDYETAAQLYGGDYSVLQSANPQIAPEDHAALWRNACEINGYQCLPVRRILDTEKFSLNEFHLRVEFQDENGDAFVQGPCCGADEEEMPPRSEFDVHAIESNGQYLVVSLPVYVP